MSYTRIYSLITLLILTTSIDCMHQEVGHQNSSSGVFSNAYATLTTSLSNLKDTVLHIPAAIYNLFVSSHPHEHITAHVRYTELDDICNEEKNFIAWRKNRIQKTVPRLLGIDVPQDFMPHIALCTSGGGFRATLMSLGFLQGADESGLLDSTLYMAGLSGSTFTIAPWLASGKPIGTYRKSLETILKTGLNQINTPAELRSLFDLVVQKGMSGQSIGVTDIFGAIIANTLLRNSTKKIHPITVTMTEALPDMHPGNFPLPICSAIDGAIHPYTWLEFTPFEVGKKNNYIPLWAYGRNFNAGSSTDFTEEQTFGYFLGLFGSAYAISLKDAIRSTVGNIKNVTARVPEVIQPPLNAILSMILQSSLAHDRVASAIAPNFTYRMSSSADNEQPYIQAADAGIDFNIPLPPLLRAQRNVDMIIIYDASEDIEHGKELFCAEHYARTHNLPFPTIDYTDIHKVNMSIFKDDDNPLAPVIVYFPRIKNESFSPFDPNSCLQNGSCGMLNFEYDQELFDNLCDLPRFTLKQNMNVIRQELIALVERKKQRMHA